MNGEVSENGSRRTTGSVKAAVHLFGEKMSLQGSSTATKKQQPTITDIGLKPPKQPSKIHQLYQARKSISDMDENRKAAETARAEAEHKLQGAKKTVKELTSQIEDSNPTSRGKLVELKKLNTVKQQGRREEDVFSGKDGDDQYDEAMRDLESMKRELIKLKLDMENALNEIAQAENGAWISYSKAGSLASSVEALRKEIDEVNEEQVLVELAQIQALKELAEIEAQRKEEARKFSLSMEKMRAKITAMVEETERVKELEAQLATTNSDINMLQNEVKSLKKMGASVSLESCEALEQTSILKAVTEEMEREKQHLALMRREVFQLMGSMDGFRKELVNTSEEIDRMKRTEEKTDKAVKNLHSKLLRARNKLEAAIRSEEKELTISSSLSAALNELKKAKMKAEDEIRLVTEETESARAEARIKESEIESTVERLRATLQELDFAKSAEATALEKLRDVSETAMRSRACSAQHSSKITISKFEYEYLSGSAVAAKETADMKVEAATRWAGALRASEREAKVKIEVAKREIKELRLKEEEIHQTQTFLNAEGLVEGEIQNQRERWQKITTNKNEPREEELNSPSGGKMNPYRRRSVSPAPHLMSPRPASFTIKRRTKVMPIISKYFAVKQTKTVSSSQV